MLCAAEAEWKSDIIMLNLESFSYAVEITLGGLSDQFRANV